MAYKDKDKQREADKIRQQRRRDVIKSKGVTNQGVTQGVTITKTESHLDASEISMVKALHQTINKPKRGKDIKCFADLPPDVQQTIDSMSIVNGKIDQTIKANRTAIAINYQHLFPDSYVPKHIHTSDAELVIGKPGDADYNGICTEAWRTERGR